MDKVDLYMIVEPLYRLHRDLLELENAVKANTWLNYEVSATKATSIAGIIAIALLGSLTVMVSVCKISFESTPALVIYGLVLCTLLLRILLGVQNRQKAKMVGLKIGMDQDLDTAESHDFLREIIASYGNRIRILWEVIPELEQKIKTASSPEEKNRLEERLSRYREVLTDCVKWVKWAVDTSLKRRNDGKRTQEEHDEIVDWAKPFLDSERETDV